MDLPGEAGTIMHAQTDMGEVELATTAFGQSFQITPLHLITTAASLVNGGHLVTPHFGVHVLDAEGNLVKTFTYDTEKTIISEDSSRTSALYSEAGSLGRYRKESGRRRVFGGRQDGDV